MRRRALIALLLLPFLLSGCWNKVEIEENAYVLAIGIDKGERNRFKLTVAIAQPAKLAGSAGGGGGGKEEKPMILTTVDAPSLAGALSMLNGYMGRTVTLQHTKALFVSEDLARDTGLSLLDEVVRFRQTRQTIFLVITKQKASDFLEGLKPSLTKNPLRYIEELTYNYRINGMMPATSQISSFVSRINVNYVQPLTYYASLAGTEKDPDQAPSKGESGFKAGELPHKGGSSVEMIGGAAFRGQKMVGVLNAKEVRDLLILQDTFRQAFCTFKDPKAPDKFVSVQLTRGRPTKVRVDVSGSRPRITGEVSLEAEILGIQSGVDYSEPELQDLLEASIDRQIAEPLHAMVAKTQEWKTDVIGFGRKAISHFPTVEAWEAYDWPSKYPEADVRIDVKVTLRRFGLILSPVSGSAEGE